MEPSSTPTSSALKSAAIPLAIVFGFALIALAIYFSGLGNKEEVKIPTNNNAPATVVSNIRPVDGSDYVRGNPNAPILIVEYSDYDCPFCKNYHETMTQIMDEYGVNGKIAWVYRQFPIAQLHPNSPGISEAALCVGDVAGNDAFWKFSDLIFGERAVNEPTNITKLPDYAVQAGASEKDFMACLESGRMQEKLKASYAEAAAAGINGTPHSFVIVGNQQAPIEGAQPYEVVKQIIENLLGQLEAGSN
jgi:protein-disulfide isomerase